MQDAMQMQMTSEVSKKEFAGMGECQARRPPSSRVSGATTSVHRHVPCLPVGSLINQPMVELQRGAGMRM